MKDDRDILNEINIKLTLQTSEMEAIRGHIERVERDVTVIKHKVIGGGEERPLQIRVEDAERDLRTLKDRDEGQRVDKRTAVSEVMVWFVGLLVAAIVGVGVTLLVTGLITG